MKKIILFFSIISIITLQSCTPEEIEEQTKQTIEGKGLSDGGGNTEGTTDIPKKVLTKGLSNGGRDTTDTTHIPK